MYNLLLLTVVIASNLGLIVPLVVALNVCLNLCHSVVTLLSPDEIFTVAVPPIKYIEHCLVASALAYNENV